ncbi:hypothetical protein BS78_K151200 [Paspalum vaginatum]|uniref:EGF-like domain-containing protein n=1 Tax=Paspalum vaginatum TaxID=158149 RepID=A0A9W7X7I1_9POAL|nr:hypothetical protein BS78_K151200 [Paspalum vaginatum]
MEFARLLLPILQLVAVVWVLAAVDVVPVAAQSPAGCSRRCGNVDIPYPFGLETRCAIHGGFVLRCNTTAGKLFHGDTVEVTKISVEDNKSRFNTWTSWQCYDRSTGQMKYSDAWLNLTGTVYVLSADDNKIIVLGCNNMGYMIGDTYVVGCLTKCDGTSPMVNGTCSSTSGCCEAEVPRGVRAYNGYFNPSYNTTKIWQTTPCNYVAVVESASFEFSTTYLTSTVFYDTHKLGIPVVMEWGITRSTCEQAQNDETTPYACVSSNSSCATNDAGYVCRCSKGYQGNPYIVDGCTDIDECNNGTSNPCTSGICENTPGGYTCSCPRGQSMSDNGVCKEKQKLTWMALVVDGPYQTDRPQANRCTPARLPCSLGTTEPRTRRSSATPASAGTHHSGR